MDTLIFPTPSIDRRVTGLDAKFANREKLLADGAATDAPPDPLLAIRGRMCVRCLGGSPSSLKACGACMRVYYCSAGCQKMDWVKVHKTHCKALQRINTFEDEEYDRLLMSGSVVNGGRSWTEYRNSLNEKCELLWDIVPEKRALDLITGQAYCNTCYITAYQLKKHAKTSLEACQDCQLSFQCEHCHNASGPKQPPAHECELYQLLSADSFYRISRFNAYGEMRAVLRTKAPARGRTLPKVASLSGGWFDYYARLQGWKLQRFVHPSAFQFITPPPSADEGQTEINRGLWAEMRAGTDTATMVMTVARGLESAVGGVHTKTSLLVHIVGAGDLEYGNREIFEDILHLFPSLQELRTVFIGPHVPPTSGRSGSGAATTTHAFTAQEVCTSCTTAGRKHQVATYQGAYHDFYRTRLYAKPDLAVAFHSGQELPELSESPVPSTQVLVDEGVLTLCTAVSRDQADREMAELQGNCRARIVSALEENRWKSILPLPRVRDARTEHAVVYLNHYWYMFQGRNQ